MSCDWRIAGHVTTVFICDWSRELPCFGIGEKAKNDNKTVVQETTENC